MDKSRNNRLAVFNSSLLADRTQVSTACHDRVTVTDRGSAGGQASRHRHLGWEISVMSTNVRTAWSIGIATTMLFAMGNAAQADLITVTLNPSAAVAGATPFTADSLNLLDFSRVDVTSTGSFTENGVLQISSASLSNIEFNPTGNGSSYSLYIVYNATGTQSAPNFNGASSGAIRNLTYTFYETAGMAQYGINSSNQPFVTPAGTATVVATGSLIAGSTSFSTSPLSASANFTASFAQQLAGFIVSPTNTTLTLTGAFNNDSRTVTVLNGGSSLTLNGGRGNLTFSGTTTSVPEPVSLALLGTGLVAFGTLRRRKK